MEEQVPVETPTPTYPNLSHLNENELIDILNQEEGRPKNAIIFVKTPTCGKCQVVAETLNTYVSDPEKENTNLGKVDLFEFNPAVHRKIVENKKFQQLRTVPALLFVKEGEVSIYPSIIETWQDFQEAVDSYYK